jgi:hypothetical protein
MNADTLIAIVAAFATVEATVVGGVWVLSSRLSDLQSAISKLEAHRVADAGRIDDTTAKLASHERAIRGLSERVAVVEAKVNDR